MKNPFNRYQDYEREANKDAYEYEKRCYDQEERYREAMREELDMDYFGDCE